LSVHAAHGAEGVSHQFETIEQQNESYLVGMWSFLVTEIMFFGGLFLAYVIYRLSFQATWYEAHKKLDVNMGLLNTFILLTSSLFMALGVRAAQLKERKKAMGWLCLVLLCAFGFLVVKYIEYSAKFEHHLFPGPNFHWEGANPGQAQMFFNFYFAMTGLHGIHVAIGILVIGALVVFMAIKHPCVEDYMPTEMTGLYWHFVDIVWIFLFPLYYLMPKG
jgi:cytochrome c oxidase subunit 3